MIHHHQLVLLLGVGDLHSMSGSDLKSSEGTLSLRRLYLRLKLNKGNVAATRDKTNFLEARKSETTRTPGNTSLKMYHTKRVWNVLSYNTSLLKQL